MRRTHLTQILLSTMLLLGLVITLSGRNVSRTVDREHWVSHTYQVSGAICQTLSDLKDCETGQRGYLLTQQESYLQPYENGVDTVYKDFDTLEVLVSDNPDQLAILGRVRPLAVARIALLAQTISLSRSGHYADAIAIVKTGQGRDIMDQIRGDFLMMSSTENRLLTQRLREAEQAQSDAHRSIDIDAALGCSLLVIGLFLTVFKPGKLSSREGDLHE